jgi:transcriptional regulator with XRE-family HTH domain
MNDEDNANYAKFCKAVAEEFYSLDPIKQMEHEIWESARVKNLKFEETVSERLKKVMAMRNCSQTDLSRMSGIPKQKINQYVNGRFNPKYDTIQHLAIVLNVSPAWLSGRNVPMARVDMYETEKEQTFMGDIAMRYGSGAIVLLREYYKLNKIGKDEAVKRILELAMIPQYCETGKQTQVIPTSAGV